VRVLLDSCVWGGARSEVEAAGHDVTWVGDWPEDPGDETILRRALEEGRTLITLDKDFGELVIVHGQRHPGLVRLVGFSARAGCRLHRRALSLWRHPLRRGDHYRGTGAIPHSAAGAADQPEWSIAYEGRIGR
jgi:predicted nuclease of predicted toxin-antitoxin system